jgi:hypothetical protein
MHERHWFRSLQIDCAGGYLDFLPKIRLAGDGIPKAAGRAKPSMKNLPRDGCRKSSCEDLISCDRAPVPPWFIEREMRLVTVLWCRCAPDLTTADFYGIKAGLQKYRTSEDERTRSPARDYLGPRYPAQTRIDREELDRQNRDSSAVGD